MIATEIHPMTFHGTFIKNYFQLGLANLSKYSGHVGVYRIRPDRKQLFTIVGNKGTHVGDVGSGQQAVSRQEVKL